MKRGGSPGEEDGFTLVELLVSIAIAGGIIVAVGLALYQTWRATVDSNDRLLVTDDLRTVGSWLTEDAQMADLGLSSATANTLTLIWTDVYSDVNVIYRSHYAVASTQLQRGFGVSGTTPATITIARRIAAPADVSFSLGGGLLTATITATSGTVRETTRVQASSRRVASSLSGTTVRVNLQPGPEGADTYIDKDHATTNYGAKTELKTDSESPKPMRALLRFDVSAIPAGSTIVSATLHLYAYSVSGVTTDQVRVHRLTRSWTETGATWNRYDGVSNWTTAGGDYDATVEGSFVANPVGWKYVALTSLVQKWVSGTVPNYGVILESPAAGGNNEKKYYPSEWGGTTQRPYLVIDYQ